MGDSFPTCDLMMHGDTSLCRDAVFHVLDQNKTRPKKKRGGGEEEEEEEKKVKSM